MAPLFPSLPLRFFFFPLHVRVLSSIMATSRRRLRPPAPESRAPPPSPVAGLQDHALDSQDHDEDDDDELSRFLKRTRPVPKLTLPHRIVFPPNAAARKPQEIDFVQLIASQSGGGGGGSAAELIRSAAETFGCMQIVNHGVPVHLAGAAAESAFRVPRERKAAAARSPERRWGFESGDDEEFFWWDGSEMGVEKEKELAGIWPDNYKDFCARIKCFCVEVEKIARKIEEILLESDCSIQTSKLREEEIAHGSMVCFHRHGESGSKKGGPKDELLLMLVRSWSCSCALSLHFCRGAPEFHAYSKRSGWVQFAPSSDAIVVTIGDQLETRSGGLYKHVAGKPAFENADHHDSVSIAYHYNSISSPAAAGEKIITVAEQVMIAAWLVLFYHMMLVLFCSRT